ncbi:branched-chain amino acid transport system substrate-binding protein [Natronocella acetinitrilica]|uniref:Branched-chain amino acid transport system substrate-binding protein n=1 Tax=Natronocella acetinitrilica TaxID=414046 RepID=A0AAE3G2X3_9GAMM|nr:ABC transporter substrate-binding protein [Natronocella acetinitrilica]MCP1674820.1 branched-chain amino acid transport system substrate-binding protein [Natronocella acetinitrilica]
MVKKSLLMAAAASVALSGGMGTVHADEPLRIGVLATLEGVFAASGQDGMRGFRMAMEKWGHEAGGREIRIFEASSDASPDSALRAARRLVENDEVDIMIGPLSGSEGIAIKNYSMEHPGVTFLNGSSAAQQTTLEDPSENFFRFSTDGVQWQAGLGSYVYEEKGYESVAIIAEDYSFPYALIKGFMTEFCDAGGRVPEKFFVPLETRDYSSVIARMPQDVDAIYVALGGSDALNFLEQYQQMGGAKPMIAGSITVDQSVLSARGRQRDYLIGTPTAGPVADNYEGEEWQEFVATYREMFPDGLRSPGLFAHSYYVNTLAALTALDQVNGDLSDGHAAFREALQNLELETPTGVIQIDHNRQAIADVFITEVAQDDDGSLYNRVVDVRHGVNQTLGFTEEEFLAGGFAARDNPECP